MLTAAIDGFVLNRTLDDLDPTALAGPLRRMLATGRVEQDERS